MLLRGCRYVFKLVICICRVYVGKNESSGILPLLLQATFIFNRHNSGPFCCLNNFSNCLNNSFSCLNNFSSWLNDSFSCLPERFVHDIFVKRFNLNVKCPPLERRNIIIPKDTIVADGIPGLTNNLIEAVISFTEMSIILSLPYIMYVIIICMS